MTPKQTFINTEIWLLTFGGAFQRANVYADNIDEAKRKGFRNALIAYVEKNIIIQYQQEVSEDMHINNIHAIISFSTQFSSILKSEKLTFGVTQKILNLFLKYQWCLGNISTPPHFPVDRIIQSKLELPKIINWTSLDSEMEYRRIIDAAKSKAVIESRSLAEWELVNFSRR